MHPSAVLYLSNICTLDPPCKNLSVVLNRKVALTNALPMADLNAQIHSYFCSIQHTNAQCQCCHCVHCCCHCWGHALGQYQCTNSFIILLNTTYKCPMLMLHLLPLPWLCPLPLPLPRLCPLPMPMLCHWPILAHGQSQYINSFILLLNITFKCPIPMPYLFLLPLLLSRLCPLLMPMPSPCEALPMVNFNTQIHLYFC